jgi:hypothetical protein|nr:MAG TPA: hypothetical protein [Caudoviricetes sp.]
MYDKTITVFNKYVNQKDEIFWYPTVIKGVQLIVDKSANIEKTGLDTADTATLHVLYRMVSAEKVVSGKKYLEPKKWAKQINDTLGHTITFASSDFFIEGEYDERLISDEDYQSRRDGGFYDYMNKNHDNVFLITNVGTYTLIPHFEIGGK